MEIRTRSADQRRPLLAGRRSPAAPPAPGYSCAPRHLGLPRSVPPGVPPTALSNVSSGTFPRRTWAGNPQGPDPNGTDLPGPRQGRRDTRPRGKFWHLLEAAQERGEDHSMAPPARHRMRRGGGVREDTACGSHPRSSSGSWARRLETGAPRAGGLPRTRAMGLRLGYLRPLSRALPWLAGRPSRLPSLACGCVPRAAADAAQILEPNGDGR